MKWALRDPVRFLHERDQFEKLLAESSWLKGLRWKLDPAFTVEVELDVEVHGSTYAMKLTYPDLFPETPAYIRPRDTDQHWSGHQYGPGGTLCLEWRADNWDPQVTGVDLVRSAYKLLATECNPEQPGEVPSVHELSRGQEVRGREQRFVCTPALLSFLASTPSHATRRMRTSSVLHAKTTIAFASHFENGDRMEEISDLPSGISQYGPLFTWRRDAHVLKSEAFNESLSIASLQDIAKAIQGAGFSDQVTLTNHPGNRLVLFVGTTPNSLRVLSISVGEEATMEEYHVLLPDRLVPRLPDEHERLREIRVGIAGLGSLGSKVAVSLARSGVRKFLLVDDDVLTPANLCRNELGWEAVGMHKVEAVREALSLTAPNIDVDVRQHRIAGQESALGAAAVVRDLGSCDVLIDATANPEVFLRLASVARASQRPICWGEVFAGGLGGIIARARPQGDPNPVAVRSAIISYLQTLPPAPYRQEQNYNTGGAEPIIAYDSEVGQIAAALTRFVLDVVLRGAPSSFPYSAYLIGFRREWIFSQPFDTHPIQINGEGWENPSASAGDRAQVVNTLLQMSSEGQHANADSSA